MKLKSKYQKEKEIALFYKNVYLKKNMEINYWENNSKNKTI